jgi:predicted ATPase/DNA-binding CsgD family transcriptional regulator/tRNA A-37 threonylcarbamoyl transferase component Bud32
MADRVGQQLGNYRLVALLGQGSYAQVYLGQHVRFKQQAALKVLHAHLSSVEAEHFQREAETIARLSHPGIIRVLDFDIQEGVPFLVMDYVPNGSLRQRYPKGSLVPLPVIVSVVKQVAEALQYAHEQKVIHRDVKPENMLLGRREEVLLSDFGIATVAHSTSSLSTSAEGTSGTLAYMAPEQIEGHPRSASDQYALAVVVYEWLCGERPFEGSVSELIAQHLSMPPPALRERVLAILAEVEWVVLRSLAKDPKQRFASMQDFALALEVASTAASTGSTRPVLASAYTEARHTTTHNLPAHLTPLLGREQEVVAACTILRRPDVRLVTLTGPGGIGKTRLAVQLATELLADFVGGVSFVSLAPISDSELVIPAIAQTLEVKESGALPLMDLLKAFLKDKHVLLVLDNFEQLLEASPQLTDLLSSCQHLKLLVTSRAALHLQGEHEFLVSPLAVPDLTRLPEQEVLSQYAAVALFLQRAQAVKSAFQLTSSNARPIAEICARLDGLPLAIELAAARIKMLPPQALLARLGQRLAVLIGGARDAPARHQTLRNTIEWSYQLLEAEEQRLFQCLSVFAGGCTLEAVEAIDTELDGEPGRVLGGVAALIDKSLLQQTELEGEDPRFVMLETIREYGLECLLASGKLEVTWQAHARYYLALAEEAEPELVGPQQVAWLERLEREHDNLRAAMRSTLEQWEIWHHREMALRLGGALQRFWEVRGHWSEGWIFLERALVGRKGVTVPVQIKALKAAAHLAWVRSDTDRASALSEECLTLCREIGDTAGIAHCLDLLGSVAWRKYNFAVAISLNEESLSLFREVGHMEGIAWALFNLADVLFLSQGNPAKVHALLEENLALCREMGHKEGIAQALGLLSLVFLQQGDIIKARSLLDESLVLSKEIGERSIAWLPILIGKVVSSEGDFAAARAIYEESLAITLEGGDKMNIAEFLEGLAATLALQEEPVWAARLWGTAESMRDAIGMPLPPVDRTEYVRSVTTARASLGERAFAKAWAEGRTMTPEQAFAAYTTQEPVVIPSISALLGQASAAPAPSKVTYPDGLTSRQVELLRLVAQGLTNEQVAEQLTISPRTVNTHLTSIYGKIQVSSRAAATRYAIEHQLV